MPRAIIFANGDPLPPATIRAILQPDDDLICADGGTLHLRAAGLWPDLVVGDMDSLPPETLRELETQGIALERHPREKDETDLELALQAALRRGADEICLLTLLGGRLDQQLANILLLTRSAWAGVRLSLAAQGQRGWLLRGPDRLTLNGSPGDTFSLVPLSPQVSGVTLRGLAWPLDAAQLSLGTTRTISNRFTEAQAEVSLEEGVALALHLFDGRRQTAGV